MTLLTLEITVVVVSFSIIILLPEDWGQQNSMADAGEEGGWCSQAAGWRKDAY
jgi:hypothetical protein